MKKIIMISIVIINLIIIPTVNAENLNCNKYLKYGNIGSDIKTLQNMLNNSINCNLNKDGIFGNQTKKCVIKFQEKYNLDKDGIVGPITCNKLNTTTNNTNTYIDKIYDDRCYVNGNTKILYHITECETASSNNSLCKYDKANGKEEQGTVLRNKLLYNTSNCSSNTSINNSNIINSNEGIVIGDIVNVRAGTSTKDKIVTTINIGTKVNIISKNNNWYKVKLDNKQEGYIREDLVSKGLIIVDISEQKLYYSQEGKLILEAPVITGNKGTNDTPIGNYVLRVNNKKINTTLQGYNNNGTRYNSFVNYWMPFIGNSIGFHDASWRTDNQFNTSTYITNGSHGCVNMKFTDTKILYTKIVDNTAVIVRN